MIISDDLFIIYDIGIAIIDDLFIRSDEMISVNAEVLCTCYYYMVWLFSKN